MDPSEKNLFDLGTDLLRHQAYRPALTLFRYAAGKYPQAARLQVGLGVSLYSTGNYTEEREKFGFEGVGEALGAVFADAQADGDVGGGGQAGGLSYWGHVRRGVGDAEGFLRPLRGQGGQVEVAGAAVAAAFEEVV